MTKPFETWTVLPHGKLTQVDRDILTVVGDMHMPLGDIPRRMTIVRLKDRGLVIYSAIALEEDEMKLLEGFGRPQYLIVPSDIHRTDAKIWKDRYPALHVVAPAGSRAKVEEVVPVDATGVDFADRRVELITVEGTDGKELALEVHGADGITLIVNDLIWNVGDRPGFGGWLLHALGFTGTTPHLPSFIERRTVRDREALRAQLEHWAEEPQLRRIIVSHGDVLTREPGHVLHDLATQLVA
jgi:hypothetical protein